MRFLRPALAALLVCCLSQNLWADERSELKSKMASAVAAGDRSAMADCARQAGALGLSGDELKSMISVDNPKLGTYESNFKAAASDLRKSELFLNGIDAQISAAQKGLKAKAIKEGFKKLVEEQAPKPEDGVYKVLPGVGQYQQIKGVLEAMASFGRAAKKGILSIEDLKTQRASAQLLVNELGWNGESKGLCQVLNKDLNDYKDKLKGWDSDFDRQYKDGVDNRKDKLAKLRKDAEDAKKRENDRLKAEAKAPRAPVKTGKPAPAKAVAASTVTHTEEVGWAKGNKGTTKVSYVKDANGRVLKVIHTHFDKSGKQTGKDVYPGDDAPAVLPVPPKAVQAARAPVRVTKERDNNREGGGDKCGGGCD